VQGFVALVTTELVTHALLHGYPPITLTIECEVTQVRISVSDAGCGPLTAGSVQRELSLMLIDQVVDAWGLLRTDQGETFWCTMPMVG
jgi:anti-sigma regulatory factor (Ser/Thr protein kinase)